ncbi:PREDICTED: putative uncharacterized protein DDB_G0284213 [Priapulus caudatus]|uniref:Uncharacterized protein n=1 Tax=Priapulus caudatus TaxID=37621 RepID=A0ABM1FA23_PRICU|nr:PREDICTED: putative uncharacterized protein DDB_G0284213 [Priapulus caudatus]
MAAPIEDLDFNPFFRNLQTKFEAVYRDAQQRCCLICVPSTQAICDINITEQFIESHIFRPSPYFRGQYISLDKNDEKTIKIEDGVIKSVQGFRNSFKMKIIGEELGYNNDFKTYRIVIVDGIIAEIFKRVTTSQEQLDLIKLDRSSMGSVHSDCREFLARLPAAERLLRSLDAQAQSFSDTYMVLEAYLDDAARKVRQICANCAQDYLHRNPEYAEGPDVKALEAAIESCVTHALHRKVYSVVKRHLAAADSDLQRRLEAFRAMTLAQLEVRSELWFPYTNAGPMP